MTTYERCYSLVQKEETYLTECAEGRSYPNFAHSIAAAKIGIINGSTNYCFKCKNYLAHFCKCLRFPGEILVNRIIVQSVPFSYLTSSYKLFSNEFNLNELLESFKNVEQTLKAEAIEDN